MLPHPGVTREALRSYYALMSSSSLLDSSILAAAT